MTDFDGGPSMSLGDEKPIEDGAADPFDAQHAPAVQLVVQMRIYDVLMGIYTNLDPEGAAQLYDLHKEGKIIGSLPFIDLKPEDLE